MDRGRGSDLAGDQTATGPLSLNPSVNCLLRLLNSPKESLAFLAWYSKSPAFSKLIYSYCLPFSLCQHGLPRNTSPGIQHHEAH